MQTLVQLNGTVLRVIMSGLSTCDSPASDDITDNKAVTDIQRQYYAEEYDYYVRVRSLQCDE